MGQPYRIGAVQQHLRDRIFGGALRSGMAADADPLLAAARPEPALLGRDDLAGAVQQFEADGRLSRRVHKERSVLFHRRLAEHHGGTAVIQRPDPHLGHGALGDRQLRRVHVQAQQVGALAIAQRRRKAFGNWSRLHQNRLDCFAAGANAFSGKASPVARR